MKISQLIKYLESVRKEHGDLEVLQWDSETVDYYELEPLVKEDKNILVF